MSMPGATPSPPPARAFSRTARTVAALDRAAHRRGFMPALSAFPLADYVLPILPNQMLLVALCILQPRRWWRFALVFVFASGLGAAVAALAVQAFGPPIIDSLFGGLREDASVAGVKSTIERHGIAALTVLAMLPWAPRSAVMACGLAGLSPWAIGLAVAVGRLVPTAACSLLGAKAPQALRQLRAVDRLLDEVEALRRSRRLP